MPPVITGGCGRSRDLSGPQKILDRYTKAIRNNQPEVAYQLLDEKTRQQLTRSEFIKQWKSLQPELGQQALQIRAQMKQPLPLKAKISFGSGIQADLVCDESKWKIDDNIVGSGAAATPKDAIRALIKALEQRNLRAMIRLLARSAQASLDEDLSELRKKLQQKLAQKLDILEDEAALQIDPDLRLKLVREDQNWRFKDFNWLFR